MSYGIVLEFGRYTRKITLLAKWDIYTIYVTPETILLHFYTLQTILNTFGILFIIKPPLERHISDICHFNAIYVTPANDICEIRDTCGDIYG